MDKHYYMKKRHCLLMPPAWKLKFPDASTYKVLIKLFFARRAQVLAFSNFDFEFGSSVSKHPTVSKHFVMFVGDSHDALCSELLV